MPAYDYAPLSINGITIVAGTIRAAYWDGSDPSPLTSAQSIGAVQAVIPGVGSQDVRGQPQPTNWTLTVELSATNQVDLEALNTTFNEQAGFVYFRVTDGGGKVWRVQVRQVGAPKRTDVAQWKIPLSCPNPLWQEDANAAVGAGTGSEIAKSANFNFTLTNAGDRKCRPLFTITADAAKTGVANDFGLSLQGFIVNKAPQYMNNKPVYLTDVAGAASRIDMSAIGLASGDDTRVWLDDVPDVTRYMVNPHANPSDVVCYVSLPAAITLTLVTPQQITAGNVPANGGSFSVNEDISWMPARGFVVIENEVIYYASRAGRTFLGIQRGQWGTTAAAHAAAVNVWANPKHYVIGTAYSGVLAGLYGPPPAPPGQRPAIDLPASSNQGWKWGDTASDASTIFWDPANPDRGAQWGPDQIQTDDPVLYPYTTLMNSAGDATFQDSKLGSVQGTTQIQGTAANSLAVQIAQKIASGASGITYDCTLDPALVLDIYGVALGTEQLLAERVGGSALTGQTITTPANLNGRLRFAVKHGCVVGTVTGDYSTVTATDTQPLAQTFTLQQQTIVTRLAVRVQQGVGNMLLDLCPVNNDGTVNTTNKLMTQVSVANASLNAGSVAWNFIDLSASPITLAAGKYALIITAATAGTGTVIVSRSNGSVYAAGEARTGIVGTVNVPYTADWTGYVNSDQSASDKNTQTTFIEGGNNSGAAKNYYGVLRFPVLASQCPPSAIKSVKIQMRTDSVVAGSNPKFSAYAAQSNSNWGQDDPNADTVLQMYQKSDNGRQINARVYELTGTAAGGAGNFFTDDFALFSANGPQPTSPAQQWIVTDLKAAVALNRFTVALGPINITGNEQIAIRSAQHATPGDRPIMTVQLQEDATASFGSVSAWDYGVRIYGSPTQADAPSNTAGQTIVPKFGVAFATNGGIYVHRIGTFGTTLLHCVGLLTNTTTGDSIQIDKWMAIGATLAIDCDARTCVYTDVNAGGVAYPMTKAITCSNMADWMALNPGANAFTWAESGLAAPGQLDLVTTYRGVKV